MNHEPLSVTSHTFVLLAVIVSFIDCNVYQWRSKAHSLLAALGLLARR
jgi:hypothetical protein